jgi:uncharacterized damage-inducible protein DinB
MQIEGRQGEKIMKVCSIACFVMLAAFSASTIDAQMNASTNLGGGIKQSYNAIKSNLLKAADKMPEEGYSFQPTKEERNFGGWVAHVADAQTGICSGIAGTPTTINAASKTTKADLVAALKQSFDTCDAVYDGLTSANAADAVPFFRGKQARLDALAGNVAHDNECYGSMAVYMRLKGLVPPSSEPRPPAGSIP